MYLQPIDRAPVFPKVSATARIDSQNLSEQSENGFIAQRSFRFHWIFVDRFARFVVHHPLFLHTP
jgi:hypothetical protein